MNVVRVVAFAVARPSRPTLDGGLRLLHAAGATTYLVLLRQPAPGGERAMDAAAGTRMLRGDPAAARPRRYSPAWVRSVALSKVPSRPRAWLLARSDASVRAWVGEADVLVALDRFAIFTVWRLARRNRRPAAVFGMDAAVREVRRQAEEVSRPGPG